MAKQPEKSVKKSKSKPPVMSPRTMALAAVFLVLVGAVAWVWTRNDGTELPDDAIPSTDGGAPGAPAHQPVIEIDPATLPPGSTEEIRPS